MNYGLLFRTVRHLRPRQIVFQVLYRLHKPRYKAYRFPLAAYENRASGFKTEPIPRYDCCAGNRFTFLNLEREFAGWNFADNGMLWAYNQNYFDWLNQEGFPQEEGCRWIDRFIAEMPGNRVGLDPYPTALRIVNWVKFFCKWPQAATRERLDSLYSQLRLLERRLEWHLMGNHLLEDAFALYIGAAYCGDARLLKRATKLVLGQLKEQILQDGAHYEQSVMYHCILLDRLLDCINLDERVSVNGARLRPYAQRMVGWLKSIVYEDGTMPMMNDAALCIAPPPNGIIAYAERLGIGSEATPLGESGYRRMRNSRIEATVDVGNITATYQPGHTHADTFSYELRIDGQPFVVDTGISTYNKTERRQYERSTAAHNTVSVNGKNSSEVWDGFRVGARAEVKVSEDELDHIKARLSGFATGTRHERTFGLSDTGFSVTDSVVAKSDAVSYIHLAPGVEVLTADGGTIVTSSAVIKIEGGKYVTVIDNHASTEYNRFDNIKVIEIHFSGSMSYHIQP